MGSERLMKIDDQKFIMISIKDWVKLIKEFDKWNIILPIYHILGQVEKINWKVTNNCVWLEILTSLFHWITEKLTIKYARSSGPGGQNVNKGKPILPVCILTNNVCQLCFYFLSLLFSSHKLNEHAHWLTYLLQNSTKLALPTQETNAETAGHWACN